MFASGVFIESPQHQQPINNSNLNGIDFIHFTFDTQSFKSLYFYDILPWIGAVIAPWDVINGTPA